MNGVIHVTASHPLYSFSLVPRRMKILVCKTTVVLCVCIYLQLILNATVRVWHVLVKVNSCSTTVRNDIYTAERYYLLF